LTILGIYKKIQYKRLFINHLMDDYIVITQYFEQLQLEIDMESRKKYRIEKYPEKEELEIDMESRKKYRIEKYPEKEERLFGYFKCNKCNNNWTSGYSWPNTWQKCKHCKINILPYNQKPLIKSIFNSKQQKPHNRESCQKCIESGRGCDSI